MPRREACDYRQAFLKWSERTSDFWKTFCYVVKFSDRKQRERYKAHIERIRREQGLQELYQAVTREDKDLNVKAIGLTQGHWYKCPNGEWDVVIKFS